MSNQDMKPEDYDFTLKVLGSFQDKFWGEDTLRALRRLIEEVEDEKEATIMTIIEEQMYGDAH